MDGFIDEWADGRRRRDGEENKVTKKTTSECTVKKNEIKKQRAK